MKISYNWLKEYLPTDEVTAKMTENPQKLGEILTSVGLEVENIEKYEQHYKWTRRTYYWESAHLRKAS